MHWRESTFVDTSSSKNSGVHVLPIDWYLFASLVRLMAWCDSDCAGSVGEVGQNFSLKQVLACHLAWSFEHVPIEIHVSMLHGTLLENSAETEC